MPLALAWALPLAIWYGIGATAPRWRPLVKSNRSVIAAVMFVLGAGTLVVGFINSDSFSGALGAMALVTAYFVRGSQPSSRAT